MAKGVVLIPWLGDNPTPSDILIYGISSGSGSSKISAGYNSGGAVAAIYEGKVGQLLYAIFVGNNGSNRLYYATVNSSGNFSTGINLRYNYSGVQFVYTTFSGVGTNYFADDLANFDSFTSLDELCEFILNLSYLSVEYISGAVLTTGPKFVIAGSTVTARVTVPYGMTVTDSDITITKNGVTVPFTYSNGVLTFTA